MLLETDFTYWPIFGISIARRLWMASTTTCELFGSQGINDLRAESGCWDQFGVVGPDGWSFPPTMPVVGENGARADGTIPDAGTLVTRDLYGLFECISNLRAWRF